MCLCFVVVVYYLCLDLMLCCVVIGYVKLVCVFGVAMLLMIGV